MLTVPVSSHDLSGKTEETETVLKFLYQLDPRETNGTLIWFETGHWMGPFARRHMQTSEWTDSFRQQVREAWSRQIESNMKFGSKRTG